MIKINGLSPKEYWPAAAKAEAERKKKRQENKAKSQQAGRVRCPMCGTTKTVGN